MKFEDRSEARYDDQLFLAAQLRERGAIKSQHLKIIAADDQQRRPRPAADSPTSSRI